MDSQERIEHLIDNDTWRPLDETLSPCDPLGFRDQKPYTERLREAQERTGLQDAVQTGTGLLDGIPIALGVMDFNFMGGSMGSVVGEKITRLIEYATQEGLTLVLVCASGGARMQEGIFSLMQMAKISSALHIYQSCANLLYISVLTSPTTGGVTASFAMLGDLIFAEPKALIGFAGRRVIEQTLQEDLPDDFQTSEYLLHHGLLDLIVPRCFLKQALSETITLYKDAPFKSIGNVPYGIQSGLTPLTEEKVRRRWQDWSLGLYGDASTVRTSLPTAPRVGEENSDLDESTRVGSSIPQFLESRLAAPLPGLGCDDPTFATAIKQWLMDTSSDEAYREILLSFQAVFSLFMDQPVPQGHTPVERSPRLSERWEEGSQLTNLSYASDSNKAVDANLLWGALPLPSHKSYGHESSDGTVPNLIGAAFEVSATETIGWRAFYTSQKASPKLALFSSLDLLTGEAAETGSLSKAVSPSSAATTETSCASQQDPANYHEVGAIANLSNEWEMGEFGRSDKQFLYNMLIKRASLDSDSASNVLSTEPEIDS
jgi:acetyl-CoA carboxylase carboxyl transferase subunit beta